MNEGWKLQSTLSKALLPLGSLAEFAENGESLELVAPVRSGAAPSQGKTVWERFRDFFPFDASDASDSLGEGNTPLLAANGGLRAFIGIENLWLKNETMNPTWSFKDRGTRALVGMARIFHEERLATISTGNMAHSTAAYGCRSGLGVVIFVPGFVPQQKIALMLACGARVIRIPGVDYCRMKRDVLGLAVRFQLRITSGNNPLRVEGYKSTAFELYEQLDHSSPDWIAIPTSACGHIRGVFKGFCELLQAGLLKRLPGMIVVQPENNSPLVSAIRQGSPKPLPFKDFHTAAEALGSGDPPGGDEIIRKASLFGWLAETVSEEEIVSGQEALARAGFLVEASAATSVGAVRKLRRTGAIGKDDSVVLLLTGSGMKDPRFMDSAMPGLTDTTIDRLPHLLESLLNTM